MRVTFSAPYRGKRERERGSRYNHRTVRGVAGAWQGWIATTQNNFFIKHGQNQFVGLFGRREQNTMQGDKTTQANYPIYPAATTATATRKYLGVAGIGTLQSTEHKEQEWSGSRGRPTLIWFILHGHVFFMCIVEKIYGISSRKLKLREKVIESYMIRIIHSSPYDTTPMMDQTHSQIMQSDRL
jgi:hypothetical protein